jgi:hypothetical protein
LQAINGLKNVDSTAMLQFLQSILNMLLQLIGDGGETLQVSFFSPKAAHMFLILRVVQYLYYIWMDGGLTEILVFILKKVSS